MVVQFWPTTIDPYDLTNAVLRMKAYQQVYMVLVATELFDHQVVPLFNAFHGLKHSGDNFRTQQRLTVLHRKHKVIMGVGRTMV